MPGQGAIAGASVPNSRASKRRARQNRPGNPEVIARRERDAEAVALRRNGMSWDAIARTLGYSDAGHAHKAFINFMANYPKEAVEESRQLELDRLDAVNQAIWSRCLDSSDDNQNWAIDRFLKISDQRARLLGLNKPVRQEITVLTEPVVDDAIQALQARLQQTALAAGIELPSMPGVAEVLHVDRHHGDE
jgi:hypothetical protein